MPKFSVLLTFKSTYSLRGIEADSEEEAVELASNLSPDEADKYGHEIDFEAEIDSVSEEPSRKKRRAK